MPSKVHRQRDLLDDDTVGLITCAMPNPLWVAVLLSRDTGLRISEVVGLRVVDVDPVQRTLHLVGSFDDMGTWRAHTKGHRSGITLPLTRRLATALASHLTNHVVAGQEWLFADLDGHPVGIRRMRRAWNQARVVAGRPQAVWHDLRRTLITTLSDAGAPLQHLQALAGHSNPKTTRSYIQRVRTEDLAQWTDLIDGPEGTPPEPEPPQRHLRAV